MSNHKAPPDSLFLRRGISLSNMMKERDDDLALFHDIRKRDNKFSGNLLLPVSEEFEAVLGDKISSSPLYKIPESTARRRGGSGDFLTADGDKSDYSWLLTPPGTPLFPSLEMEAKAKGFEQCDIPVVRPLAAIKTSRLTDSQVKSSLKNAKAGLTSRQTTPSYTAAKKPSATTAKKPSATTAKSPPSSRSSTPSSRSSVSAYKPLSTSAQRSSTPVQRSSTYTAAKKPSATTAKSPSSSRSSTPSSRSSVSAYKPLSTSAQRSSTPVRRSSTPAQRSSTPAQRSSTSAQRPSTTGQKSSTPRLTQNNPPPERSSSVSKTSTMPSRNPALSRGTSPTVKPRPLQPSSIAGFTLETPPNLRTDMPGRSASANRGRPGSSSSARSNTVAPTSSNKPRRQSCSPSVTRGRVSNDSLNGNKSSLVAKKNSNGIQGAMPGVVGSKMVEKLMNARKSTPPGKVEEATNQFVGSTLNTKMSLKSVPSQSGDRFGMTISKKSLDMALRHMDIRGSMGSSIRPHMKNIPASSLYSVRSGSIKSKSSGISRSPTATSSNASSESSAKISPDPDVSKFDDDEFGSDRGSKSSRASWQDSLHFKGGAKSTNWLLSEETIEDRDDQSLISDQGFEMLSDPMDDVARALTAFEYNNGKVGMDY
ncbi:hypothetical protein SUGI_0608090 [Cryptomeria japonica]|uniref:uncharacterized protein LOC131071425 isoform X2 n=1 Tax=Cryptomeria japonica TaxID=3369 RepID=UPI0024149C45|nr:uncharacterized protein LOC131071425 isoform X2 [Cryptomeria japonica]GLJ30693.1 hypothetical protein SUGI_0608090 [Cryptomeria japonica]